MSGRGLKRSTPHRISHRLGASEHPQIAALLATQLPPSFQITPAPRADQGGSECCAEHSAVGCIATVTKQSPGSPLCLASCTYADVRSAQTPAGTALPPLTDAGAELQDVADALRRWGLAPIGTQIPGRGGWSDVPDDQPGVPFPEPDVSQVEVAGHTLIAGEYSIPVDSNAPRTVAAALVAGFPVWLGTLVGQAFQALQAVDVAQPTPDTDTTAGGHALYISGYRTAADGSYMAPITPASRIVDGGQAYEFRVENSWGSGWCDGGACWASTAWLLACWDLFPFVIPA